MSPANERSSRTLWRLLPVIVDCLALSIPPKTEALLYVHDDIHLDFVFSRSLVPVALLKDLHGGIRDGFDLRAGGMFVKIELLAQSRRRDAESLQVHLIDDNFASDEERLSGEDEEKLVQKVEKKSFQIVALRFYAGERNSLSTRIRIEQYSEFFINKNQNWTRIRIKQ